MTITRLVTLVREIVTRPGFCHAPQDVHAIVEHISRVNCEMLGLENHRYMKKRKRRQKNRQKQNQDSDMILYQHIFEDEHISVGVFLLPKNAIIPLHDHPSMSVVTLGLFGSCRLMSYDWKTDETRQAQQGEAILIQNKVMEPGDVVVCHPTSHGNIHSIQAIENFAMLDILIPPYGESRICRYYEVAPPPETTTLPSSADGAKQRPEDFVPGTTHWLQGIPEPTLNLEHELYLGTPAAVTQLTPLPNLIFQPAIAHEAA